MLLFVAGLGCCGLLVGYGLSYFATHLYASRLKILAQAEATELLNESKNEADSMMADAQSRVELYEEEIRERFEKELEPLVQKNRDKTELLNDREHDLKLAFEKRQQANRKNIEQLKIVEDRVNALETAAQKRKQNRDDCARRYVDRLAGVVGSDVKDIKQKMRHALESDHFVTVTKAAQVFEEEFQQEAEKMAKAVIQLVIDRFARAYCPERGIGNVEFDSIDAMKKTLGPDRKFLNRLEKEVGIDIAVNEAYCSASVLGFDPVRRELGRASLQRLSRERNPSEHRVVEIVANTKRELFRKIRNDGHRVSQELRLTGLSDEVRNMMGALRYRYSFAQNQYFHCAEVGFLCGLLSSELKLPVADGRRAGLLHDIGKAMDHSIDGGHAVIGADFIQKNGEAPHIVHAVRAHHHDEPPSSDLAFLVIAADAISGARPGARRSTMDSYTQKMADLEKIGFSFEGVTNTYIMSAGREVRVIVDSHKVDDHQALDLSKSIAKRIEEECSYPGLIKVTVVRETQAIDFAK